ncbi:pectin acetylesterase, partial [Trifolium medium]|nr:pectin acetylesterase [Trifolium medium]
MQEFVIPWSCLDEIPKQQIQNKIQPKPHKSFAQALTNVCDIPLSQFPQACVKGDELAIPIPEDEYLAGVDTCKHNLHGRMVWPKGATPLTVVALKEKLKPLWKDLARWGITSLGKGFYEFSFSSLEDVRRVRSVASWNLNPGYLKLFAWSGDFNPNLQKNTTAQVWVRLYGLSQEYWRPKILFAIVSSIGTPICTDAI